MKNRLIIDGNAVYEIDEECIRKKNEEEKARENKRENNRNNRKKAR